MRVHRSLIALALTASLVVPACGGDDDATAVANVTDATGAAATSVPGPPVEIPGGFPDEVPLPAAVELEEFYELVGESTTIYDITGWNAGEPVPLGEAYLAALDAAGFEIANRTDATSSVLFVAVDEDWFVSAGFYPDRQRETGTSIGLSVGPAAAAPGG